MATIIRSGSFLAVRSPKDSFYLCRVGNQIVFPSTDLIKITWLEKSKIKNHYILGKEDTISSNSVICEINLKKITRFQYRLPENAKEFIKQEISYILEQEKMGNGDGNIEENELCDRIFYKQTGEKIKTVDQKICDNEKEHEVTTIAKTDELEQKGPNNREYKLTYQDNCVDELEGQKMFTIHELNSYGTSKDVLLTENSHYEFQKENHKMDNQSGLNSNADDNYLDNKLLLENSMHQLSTTVINLPEPNRYDISNSDLDALVEDNRIQNKDVYGKQKDDRIIVLQDFRLDKEGISNGKNNVNPDQYLDFNAEKNFYDNENSREYQNSTNSNNLKEKDFNIPDQNFCNVKKDQETDNALMKTLNLPSATFNFGTNSTISQVKLTFTKLSFDKKRIYDKRHSCFICYQKCLKMARHLELKHKDELVVAKLLSLDKKSPKRRRGFLELTRIGDFYHNMETLSLKNGELILCRRPTASSNGHLNYNNFGPCPCCLGFMTKSFLHKHAKTCMKKTPDTPTYKKSIRAESNTLVNSMLFTGNTDFRTEILDKFKNDRISSICKTDSLIIGVGVLLYEKHGRSQNELIRQTMRQLARLLEAIQDQKDDFKQKNLTYFISPHHFDTIVTAVKKLCQASTKILERTEYGIPSLALKIGYNLRKCVAFLRGQSLRNGLFDKDNFYKSFLELLNMEWETKISSNALNTLAKRKINCASLLPLTSDLLKINKFITREIEIFKVLLMNNPTETLAWLRLAEATLSRVILFNKRRGGEMSRMTLSQYSDTPEWTKESTEELKNSLTQSEIQLAKTLKLIQITGKRGRVVPVLLTEEMISAINILISTRISAGVNPENTFVFARPYKDSMNFIRGPDALRTIVEKAGVESPKTDTSTKLRKYTATVCQVFNLQENEVDWLAKHLGHDIRVHRDFYRLHESAVELTKISRLLMTIDSGEVAKYSGKSLKDIQLNDFPDVQEDSDIEDVEDVTEETSKDQCDRNEIKENTGDKKETGTKRKVRQWTPQEVEAVLTFFRTEIKFKIIPGKVKCQECISKYSILNTRGWRNIKYFVKNQISKINKIKP